MRWGDCGKSRRGAEPGEPTWRTSVGKCQGGKVCSTQIRTCGHLVGGSGRKGVFAKGSQTTLGTAVKQRSLSSTPFPRPLRPPLCSVITSYLRDIVLEKAPPSSPTTLPGVALVCLPDHGAPPQTPTLTDKLNTGLEHSF